MDQNGNMVERAFSQQDAVDLARTYQTFDSIAQKMQQYQISGDGGDAQYSSSGTPASQPIVEAAIKNRADDITMSETNRDSSITLTNNRIGYQIHTSGSTDRDVFTRER